MHGDDDRAGRLLDDGREPLFELIFKHADIGLALLNSDGNVLRANIVLLKLLGRTDEELHGVPLTDFATVTDHEKDKRLFAQLIAGEIESYKMPKRYLWQNGSVVWGLATYATLLDDDGAFDCVVMMVVDVTSEHDALRLSDERAIRQAYVDVIGAVTGGRLALVTDDELNQSLGRQIAAPVRFADLDELTQTRQLMAEIGKSSENVPAEFFNAVGEAMNNAHKHAGGGQVSAYLYDTTFQVLVEDEGQGIDFRELPKATLQMGYSTTMTLGMGYTIMLGLCSRLLLTTSQHGTRALLEAEPT